VWRRPDGRPDPGTPGLFASATHDTGTTIGVIGSAPVGCDLQSVDERSPGDWERLLGPDDAAVVRHLGRVAGEPLETAATRVWSAREAMRKCGAAGGPLVVAECESPVVRFRSGASLVTTTLLDGARRRSVFAMVVQPSAVPA
jgi:enediyne polyketide synthase